MKTTLRWISFRPYGTEGVLLNANPGLRYACPGLLSILPPGEVSWAVSSPVVRLRRRTTATEWQRIDLFISRLSKVDIHLSQIFTGEDCVLLVFHLKLTNWLVSV
jgi:hypothetical protein